MSASDNRPRVAVISAGPVELTKRTISGHLGAGSATWRLRSSPVAHVERP
jgi:hypothetical protein